MKFMIDSSNIKDIKNILSMGITDGITTNPTILLENGRDRLTQILEVYKASKQKVFVQLVGSNDIELYNDYVFIRKFLNDNKINYAIKIPINKEGLKTIKKIKVLYSKEEILGTAIYTTEQGILATISGCDYLAIYYNRIIVSGEDPTEVISQIRKYINEQKYKVIVLAASLKSSKQVMDAISAGSHTCTLSPNVFNLMIENELVERDIKKFNEDHFALK